MFSLLSNLGARRVWTQHVSAWGPQEHISAWGPKKHISNRDLWHHFKKGSDAISCVLRAVFYEPLPAHSSTYWLYMLHSSTYWLDMLHSSTDWLYLFNHTKHSARDPSQGMYVFYEPLPAHSSTYWRLYLKHHTRSYVNMFTTILNIGRTNQVKGPRPLYRWATQGILGQYI